jgi:hypothetical protein
VPKHPIRGARQSPYAASRTNFRGFSHEIHSIYEAKPYLVGWTLRSPDRDSVLIGAGTSGLGRLQDYCQLTASPNLATPDTMRSCLLHVQRPKTGGFFGEGLQCHWSPASAVRVSSARSFHWTAGYRPNSRWYGSNDGRSGVENAIAVGRDSSASLRVSHFDAFLLAHDDPHELHDDISVGHLISSTSASCQTSTAKARSAVAIPSTP